MATACIPQVVFKFDKLIVAKFDSEHASSDGGALLLKVTHSAGLGWEPAFGRARLPRELL
jgi:hypothetical protein